MFRIVTIIPRPLLAKPKTRRYGCHELEQLVLTAMDVRKDCRSWRDVRQIGNDAPEEARAGNTGCRRDVRLKMACLCFCEPRAEIAKQRIRSLLQGGQEALEFVPVDDLG